MIRSLQLLGLGIFTSFAASRKSLHRRALIARVCFHSLAAYLFWADGVKTLAVGDLGTAVMSAVAIAFV